MLYKGCQVELVETGAILHHLRQDQADSMILIPIDTAKGKTDNDVKSLKLIFRQKINLHRGSYNSAKHLHKFQKILYLFW